VILALSVIALTIVLFMKPDEYTVLYPVVFGLAALTSFVYALEGVLFRKNRMVRKSRGVLFGIAGVVLLMITWLSAKVVL